jgi:tripartite-type tricarboxylate transporter receptor subunit TctC
VPYKSAGLATVALLSGEVQFMVTNMATALSQVKAGKVRALAVTSERRSALVPELPTVGASGLAGFEYSTWYGMLVPAGPSAAIVSTIHAEVKATAQAPAILERFSSQGLEVLMSSPADFSRYLASEVAKWARVVRDAALRSE